MNSTMRILNSERYWIVRKLKFNNSSMLKENQVLLMGLVIWMSQLLKLVRFRNNYRL